MSDPGASAKHRYEMSATRAEFLRLLGVAVGEVPALRGDTIVGRTCGVDWTLRVCERPERRVAQLALPVLDVALECRAADAAQIDRFVARFVLAFQRGGG
jgi:hypothetical protein